MREFAQTRVFDWKAFRQKILWLLAVVALMYATGGAGFVAVVPFALVAAFQSKHEDALFWIYICMLTIIGNKNIMPKDVVYMMAQRGLLLSIGLLMMMRLFSMRTSSVVSPYRLLFLYVGYMILPSALGWSPIISYLKMFLFCMIFIALLGTANAFAQQSRSNLPRLRGVVYTGICFMLIGSVLLIPFPDISQLSGEAYLNAVLAGQDLTSLFMGMTNQSQALGPVAAMTTTFVFADLLLVVKRKSNLHLLLLLIGPFLVYKTSSRTAMGSLLIGLFLVSFFFVKERGIPFHWRQKVKTALGLLFVAAVVGVAAVPQVRDRVASFALKFGGKSASMHDVNFEDFTSSRKGKNEENMDAFKKSPVIGNGFQVTEGMVSQHRKGMLDYLSAPMEKGVWVTAILDEGGMIGFILFIGILIIMCARFVACHAYITLSLFLTFLVSNLGEFTFFSLSYTGGYCWVMVFIGSVFDAMRLRDVYSGNPLSAGCRIRG